MKTRELIFAVAVLVVLTVCAWAGPGRLVSAPPYADPPGGIPIQGYAPNGRKAVDLTVAKTVVDHRENIAWSLYTPADCTFRIHSTATISGKKRTWVGGIYREVLKNPITPFVSYSGCTGGELDSQ